MQAVWMVLVTAVLVAVAVLALALLTRLGERARRQ
jgi:hypothetical protein